MMAPTLDELAAESDGTVVKIDVEAQPGLASRFGVRSIPTSVTFADGEMQERLVGMQEKETLTAALQ